MNKIEKNLRRENRIIAISIVVIVILVVIMLNILL